MKNLLNAIWTIVWLCIWTFVCKSMSGSGVTIQHASIACVFSVIIVGMGFCVIEHIVQPSNKKGALRNW